MCYNKHYATIGNSRKPKSLSKIPSVKTTRGTVLIPKLETILETVKVPIVPNNSNRIKQAVNTIPETLNTKSSK